MTKNKRHIRAMQANEKGRFFKNFRMKLTIHFLISYVLEVNQMEDL